MTSRGPPGLPWPYLVASSEAAGALKTGVWARSVAFRPHEGAETSIVRSPGRFPALQAAKVASTATAPWLLADSRPLRAGSFLHHHCCAAHHRNLSPAALLLKADRQNNCPTQPPPASPKCRADVPSDTAPLPTFGGGGTRPVGVVDQSLSPSRRLAACMGNPIPRTSGPQK